MTRLVHWAPRLHLNKRFWVECAAILLAVSFLVAALLKTRDVCALAQDGIFVPARVTAMRQDAPATGTSSAYLTYSFAIHDQTITNERRVPDPFFVNHPIGSIWTIRVHPDDPLLHDLFAGETRQNARGTLAAAILLLVCGAVFALSASTRTSTRTHL